MSIILYGDKTPFEFTVPEVKMVHRKLWNLFELRDADRVFYDLIGACIDDRPVNLANQKKPNIIGLVNNNGTVFGKHKRIISGLTTRDKVAGWKVYSPEFFQEKKEYIHVAQRIQGLQARSGEQGISY